MHGSCFIHVFKIKLSSFIIFVRWRRRKWHCHRTQFQSFLPLKTSRPTIKCVPVRSTKTKITQLVISFTEGIIQFSQHKRQKATKIKGQGVHRKESKKSKWLCSLWPPPLQMHHEHMKRKEALTMQSQLSSCQPCQVNQIGKIVRWANSTFLPMLH